MGEDPFADLAEDYDYDYEEEEEVDDFPDCPTLLGDGVEVFDYKYGSCHWHARDGQHVGQNGRTVDVVSCGEGADAVQQPSNGETLHSVLFRDGPEGAPNVFYPGKFGRLV